MAYSVILFVLFVLGQVDVGQGVRRGPPNAYLVGARQAVRREEGEDIRRSVNTTRAKYYYRGP